MQTYSDNDFCSIENGVKYLFARMGAIYGASFSRHWDGVDQAIIRQTWGELLGRYATYKPSMDFALKHLGKFVPSAIEFKELCSQAGRIPDKPHTMIEKQLTTEEKVAVAKAKGEAMAQIAKFTRKVVA
ncbi:hypothetical protein [Polynucleobacter asymbioticus]|jgi:hypothetical protein|uniref:Uncharacterized protein n=1 Tax=Polynucleobacter asymbioticus TaxID=576611 RepID=A0AAC9IRF8_9BURK|nr:hypothetical protein [Polynucleobacter asymbioticus]APB99043.1 hypothetical protein A4F89_06725 [Polynucleobacter asymbioticus]APC01344.1 hypothetical protein AOC25_06820 [Polynucleobacter asymbioticus]